MMKILRSLFGPAANKTTAGALATKFGLELRGDANAPVRGVAPIADARGGQLAFYSTEQNSNAFKILPISFAITRLSEMAIDKVRTFPSSELISLLTTV